MIVEFFESFHLVQPSWCGETMQLISSGRKGLESIRQAICSSWYPLKLFFDSLCMLYQGPPDFQSHCQINLASSSLRSL
jgi:hypothetical protein